MFSRYSQPFLLLDSFIRIGKLCEFISGIIPIISEEKAWEYWLHKNTGGSWGDFKMSVVPQEIDEKKLQEAAEDVMKVFMKGETNNGIV